MSSQPTPNPVIDGVAVSAPGKVLLAGGFLVLDRQYTGLIFGLDAKIHVHVQRLSSSDISNHTVVRSPQFTNAEWVYYDRPAGTQGSSGGVEISPDAISSQSRNKFIETTLTYVYTYIRRLAGAKFFGPTLVTILADEDYYSQSNAITEANSISKQNFPNFGVSLKDAHKTGLGSSAALVTALTTALLMFHVLRPEDLQNEGTRSKIHNLAQAAHCAAQGKVGSGFDVAAAVYGSCIYRRFSPSLLEVIGDPGSNKFEERLFIAVEDLEADHKWDAEVVKSLVSIPKGMKLIMCDVDCGSETPGMVKKVLSWRKANFEESEILWGTLQKGNEEFAEELRRLSSLHDFPNQDYSNLQDTILTIRSLIREMSVKSGVPIEPPVQTELLDACSAIPGVLGGVVPGAGGFDAISLLVMNEPRVLKELEKLFASWTSSVADDGGPKIGKIRLLGVKQDMEGVRIEDVSKYGPWTRGDAIR